MIFDVFKIKTMPYVLLRRGLMGIILGSKVQYLLRLSREETYSTFLIT